MASLAIPKGSTVLVTGANGLLGSHIAKQFLEHGYKVRGAVRSPEKVPWLPAAFDKAYGAGNFELVKVADMAAEGAFDEAAKGVAAIVHTASVLTFDSDPNKVIPACIRGAVNALESAFAQPSVKRFVFTSSSAAAESVADAPDAVLTEESWNEKAVEAAWAEPPYGPERAPAVYAASKTQSEREVWKYYREHRAERPDLVVNTVLPNFNFGGSIDPVNQGFPSSSAMPVMLYNGQVPDVLRIVNRQHFIDVDDAGRLHVAAAILDHVKDQRVFGFAAPFSWDTVLAVFRKHEPERAFPEDFNAELNRKTIQPRGKAEALLRELGRPGWTTLEECLLATVRDVRAAGDKLQFKSYN